jgi:bifunctional UDP-N-acetylglucosamine pyrophosphorylase/glucosamine-1-phosphate N-acetyltransferase
VGEELCAVSGERLGIIVLAAGSGTRMKSALPKPLHLVCGLPMVQHVIDAARTLEPGRIVVTVGHGGEQVRAALAGQDLAFVEQTEMLGTGDAVRRCREALHGFESIVVLNGDAPLVTAGIVEQLASPPMPAIRIATAEVPEVGRLGRVVRDEIGSPVRVVEVADYEGADSGGEINAGFYAFDAAWLWSRIDTLPLSAKGEYYLTDLVRMAAEDGVARESVQIGDLAVVGVDDRVKLAEAERVMRARIIERHQLAGVTIVDPATTYVDAAVRLAQDVTLLPNCHLQGATAVEANCTVGPGTTLRSAVIREESRVEASIIEDSEIGARCRVGPFAHVRGGTVIGDDCELGNYSEVKNSRVGRGVKMHHFSYLGDADVGEGTNIAAGAITCNWDGINKNRTTIGANVFIGCDTMLIAPVSIGDGALTGAGSVVNRDVAAGARVAGVPARLIPGKQD